MFREVFFEEVVVMVMGVSVSESLENRLQK